MPNTHTWTIEDLERDTANGGVFNANTKITSTDGTNTVEYVFKVGFTPDSSLPNYTPYDDLTEAQVLGWVQGLVSVDELNSGQDARLSQKENHANGKPW